MPLALPALADLSVLIFFVGCLVFCLLCVLVVKALFGTASSAVSWIPWVGSAASSGLSKAEQHVVNIFAAGANKSQSFIGATWHVAARMVDWIGREINSHANLLLLLANAIPGVGLIRGLLADVAWARKEVARLYHSLTHLHGSVVSPLGQELTQLNRWTHTRVKAIDHAIDVTIPKDIAGLRTRTKTIEGELSRLWDAIRKEQAALATTAFVGAVALALSKLGLGWLRCDGARQLGKKYNCGLWSRLDTLLGLVGGALLITDICVIIDPLNTAFRVVAAPMISSLARAGAGLCAAGSSSAPPLQPPPLYLPANPSDALHLG